MSSVFVVNRENLEQPLDTLGTPKISILNSKNAKVNYN